MKFVGSNSRANKCKYSWLYTTHANVHAAHTGIDAHRNSYLCVSMYNVS